jgi:hypothetical protein
VVDQQHGPVACPPRQGIRLTLAFAVRELDLQDGGRAVRPRYRHGERDERVRERLPQRERPSIRAFAHEPGQALEPHAAVRPFAEPGQTRVLNPARMEFDTS